MKTLDSQAFRVTHENYERRFLNAETAYDKYLVFKDLMDWIENLVELDDLKSAEIQKLRNEVNGYDLSEYK